MSQKSDQKAPVAPKQPNAVVAKLAKEDEEGLKKLFGTGNLEMALHLLDQLYRVMPKRTDEEMKSAPSLAMTLQSAIKPQDELEALLATQMIAVHNLAMKFLGNAVIPDQTFVGTNANIERANKLLRTFTTQMEALNRYRGKGQQKVTVEHVTVNQGGQAVIGVVERPTGGGGDSARPLIYPMQSG